MNKTVALVLKITIPIIVMIGFLFAVFFWKSFTSDANALADIVNKGNAYMNAQCYYDAIGCYEEALGYEPESAELKSALVKAYMLYAETLGETDDAIRAYQSAIDYEPANKTPYWAIASIYENRGEEDIMMDTLRTGYNATGDENMNTKVTNIETQRAQIQAEEEAAAAELMEQQAIESQRESLLSPLLSMFETRDYDGIKDLTRTDEYIAMSDEVIGDASFYCGDRDEAGNRNGKGVAIYENGYYYYGDFSNNMREGHGVWMRTVYSEASSLGSYIFEGEWSQDVPNGAGQATSNFYKDKISSEEMIKQVIKGNYSNGLEEGSMSLAGTTKAGKGVQYTYKCSAGIASKSSNDDSGVKGQYIIAKSADGTSNLTSDGSARGVEGFIE